MEDAREPSVLQPAPGDELRARLTRVVFEAIWDRDVRAESLQWATGLGMFGYAPDEVGTNVSWWRDRVHPDDLAGVMGLFEGAMERGESRWASEYRFRRRDGSWAHVAARGLLDRDAQGRAVHATGAMIDISERKEGEERERRTQRLFRLVLDTLPVGIAVLDGEGNLLLTNRASHRIWGGTIRPADERYQKSVGFWHDTGKRVTREEWGSQRALHSGETSVDELIDIETLDGLKRTMKNFAAPVRDENERIVGALVINEDVTERVRAEEELQRRERQERALAQLSLLALRGEDLQPLFDEAASALTRTLGVEYGLVFEWMPDEARMDRRALAGPWAPELLGTTPVSAAPGFMAWFCTRSPSPVVVEDLARETRFAPCELLRGHGVTSGITVPIAGEKRPFGVLGAHTTSARRFTEDEVNFVWGLANVLATSIERARAGAELREKREQLQALSRKLIEAQEAERRAVARELHDDFGQVLTALRLNLQRQLPHEKENIALVDGALARMRDLAQDLRPPQLDELGLEASLRWYVEREAGRAGLLSTLTLEPLEVPPALAVAMTCFRVLQEALTNVIRHAQARSVEIHLRPRDGQLELALRDDGVGFDVPKARRRAMRGESQGLIGMQERVELAGGELRIESVPGGGTTVSARLPLAGGSRK